MSFEKLFLSLLSLVLNFSSLNIKTPIEENSSSADCLSKHLEEAWVMLPTGRLISNEKLSHNVCVDTNTVSVSVWDYLLEKYKNDPKVKQLVFVKYTRFYQADIYLYNKEHNNEWNLVKSCEGYVGPKGIGRSSINYDRTPSGDFAITLAFGTDPNPGTALQYLQINENLYCCGDPGKYFNKIINAKALNHDCNGEHLIDYSVPYNFGFWFDYNKECKFENGYAFFFHCAGEKKYTGGCIAVEKNDMIDILKYLTNDSRICIFDKECTLDVDTGILNGS